MADYRFNCRNKIAELYLYDEIGGGLFSEGISADQVVKDVKAAGRVDQIHVRINSPGGLVFEGLAIYNVLRDHAARIIVDIDGMALSIASVIAMAGDEINMADNALFMIHDPAGVAFGTAADMRKTADTLDLAAANIARTYAKRSGDPVSAIRAAMSAETWYDAEAARDAGYVDRITGSQKLAAHFDLSRYQHVPTTLRNAQPTPRHDFLRARAARVLSTIGA